MRVLHLISSGGMYGAENVVAALARESTRANVPAIVGILKNLHVPENDVPDLLQKRGIPVLRISCRGRLDSQLVPRICRILRTENIDILHTHGYKADIFGYFAARRVGIPVVATCHLWTGQTLAIRLYDSLDRLVLKRFDRIVAVSQRIADEAARAGISSAKLSVIDNGIDLDPFVKAEPTLAADLGAGGQIVVGMVGRLVSQKGGGYFLEAAKLVLQHHSNLKFVFVGEGPDRKILEQLASDLGISHSVTFAGARTDMPGVYSSLDIFALASLDEGLPIALLEAMASGRACVATRVGAISSVIVDGHSGFLVEPADKEALWRTLDVLIRDANLRRKIGENARAQVRQKFSSGAMTSRYLQIYQELGNSGPQPAPAHPLPGVSVENRQNV